MSLQKAAKPRMPEPPAGDCGLDRLDLAILDIFQHDTRIAAEAIGDRIGLSAASVQRRLKRLRETGVIRQETAMLEPAAVGYPIMCIVGVDLDYEGSGQIDQFKARMLKEPQVQQCYYVTGPLDFVLVVLARDMADYEAFTRRVFLGDSNVRSFTTHVAMDAVKTGTRVPVR